MDIHRHTTDRYIVDMSGGDSRRVSWDLALTKLGLLLHLSLVNDFKGYDWVRR